MVVFRPPFLVGRSTAGQENTVDVAPEPVHLSADLIALGKPRDVRLPVGNVQRLDLRPLDQSRINGFRFVHLVVEIDTGKCAERELVFGRRRLLVFVVQHGIIEVGRECARTGFHDRYLILLRRIMVVRYILCVYGCRYGDRHCHE